MFTLESIRVAGSDSGKMELRCLPLTSHSAVESVKKGIEGGALAPGKATANSPKTERGEMNTKVLRLETTRL
jgi:hypothetical protein